MLLQYYIYSLPLILLTVSPFAMLIGSLYAFGELNKNNEIVTIRTCGVSIIKIASSAIFFSLLVSMIIFFVQEKTLLFSQKKVEELKSKFKKENLSFIPDEQNIAFTSQNMIVFAKNFSPRKGTLENVIIFEENENRVIEKKIISKTIAYKDKTWVGQNIIEYALNDDGNIKGIPLNWSEKDIKIKENPRELLLKKSIFAKFSSLKTLGEEIKRLKKLKATHLLNNLTIDYHQKIAEPFYNFFLVIGILPLALEIKKRKVALSSLGAGFVFGLIYYAMASFSIALGKSGLIISFLSAWVAPLFFLSVGIAGIILMR